MLQNPIHAVLAATNDIDIKNSREKNESILELFLQSKITLQNRKKILEKTKCIVKNNTFCFGSNKKSLSKIKYELTIEGSILYVVGHHEQYGRIGPTCNEGFSPEEFADKLADELGDCISQIKCVQFYVCNSAYSHDNDINNSFCGNFYKYMQTKYNNKNIIVGGFIGFLFEDPKHKHTYLTQTYNDYKKKVRAENNIIFLHNKK
jgi:hypothetical protein